MTADHELEQLLSDCRFTTSPEQEQRIMDEIADVMQARSAKLPFERRSLKTIGFRLALVVCLAFVMLVGFLLRERSQAVVWAEVQKKVAEQVWIHQSGTLENGETMESWSSASLQIDAWKNGDDIRFINYKTGIQEHYDAEQKTITRSLLGKREQQHLKESQGWLEMFNAIASGKGSVDSPAPEVQLVSQSSRQVERDGERWIEFEVKLLGPGEEIPHALLFLVDPDAHLIRSMEVSHPGEHFKSDFSYPETGPRSIHDLDVPKSARMIDLRPSDELQAVIDGVRVSAEKFGPYVSLNVVKEVDTPWYIGSPFKVWADGNKGRYEFGLIDPMNNALQKPEPDENQELWWKLRWEQLWHHVHQVSDGNQLRTNSAHPESWTEESKTHPLTSDPKKWPTPKWSNTSVGNLRVFGSPLSFAYSNQLERAGLESIETELDTDPQTGPEDTVLITTKWKLSNPQDFSESRFWIDPNKSHIVLQLEYLSGNASETHRTIITNKELAKSPRGIWYPTLVSHKTITETDRKTTETEHLTRHYLDFDTEFPKGVFEPKALSDGR